LRDAFRALAAAARSRRHGSRLWLLALDAAGADVVKPAAEGLDPIEWARQAPGARLRGGCCGTDERYLEALRATTR
jgi:S-methylmethionine-dependent homocysteine/selenocysteine methylase